MINSRWWNRLAGTNKAYASLRSPQAKHQSHNQLDTSLRREPLNYKPKAFGLRGTSVSDLQTLPDELLLMIMEHLDETSVICLKYTNHYFYTALYIDFSKLDKCTKWLIAIRLEDDGMSVSSKTKKVTCALCKIKKKPAKFTGDSFLEVWRLKERPKCVTLISSVFSSRRIAPKKLMANMNHTIATQSLTLVVC